MKKLRILLLSALFLSGCTIGGYMDMDEIIGKGKTIRAVDAYSTFLGFGYDEGLVHRVRNQLSQKCKGKITGVTTMLDVTWYVLVSTYTLTAEATCKSKG